jgi:hypothetical protein
MGRWARVEGRLRGRASFHFSSPLTVNMGCCDSIKTTILIHEHGKQLDLFLLYRSYDT